MRALIIANKLNEIKPLMDSTLYMVRELMHRKIECHWTTGEEIFWEGYTVITKAAPVMKCGYRELPELSKSERHEITDYDYVFVRKNPPFDGSYIRLCWLLFPFEDRIRFVNKPSLLLKYHEKIVPQLGILEGYFDSNDLIPTSMPATHYEAVEFAKNLEGEFIVIKPFLGYAGHDVKMVNREEFIKSPKAHIPDDRYFEIQPFDDRIYNEGDRRVFFIGGKYSGSAVRIPRTGSFVSNLGQGGSAIERKLTEKERVVISKIENWLKDRQIDFAGADLISGHVNEVNITSPTMIPAYEDLTKTDLSKALIDSIL